GGEEDGPALLDEAQKSAGDLPEQFLHLPPRRLAQQHQERARECVAVVEVAPVAQGLEAAVKKDAPQGMRAVLERRILRSQRWCDEGEAPEKEPERKPAPEP